MPIINQENSREILANEQYPVLFVCNQAGAMVLSTEEPSEGVAFRLPNLTAEDFGDSEFKKTYGLKYALYGGAMASGIASVDMVIALGKAGCMGSYGAGGMRLEVVEQAIDKIKAALGDKPYMINMLSNRNADMELELAKMLVAKGVPAVEASAYVVPSEALVYYRVKGLTQDADGKISVPHKIIAKVSREEVLEKFVCPPAADTVQSLLNKGLITAEEAALAAKIPMADDITAEADSGGHTDGRPMVSMLPALIALANRKQAEFGYQQKVRVGAGGGIGVVFCLQDTGLRHELQPHRLPDAGGAGVEAAKRAVLRALLAGGLQAAAGIILGADGDDILTLRQCGGDLKAHGGIAADMGTHRLPVDKGLGAVIAGADVEKNSSLLKVKALGKVECAGIPYLFHMCSVLDARSL